MLDESAAEVNPNVRPTLCTVAIHVSLYDDVDSLVGPFTPQWLTQRLICDFTWKSSTINGNIAPAPQDLIQYPSLSPAYTSWLVAVDGNASSHLAYQLFLTLLHPTIPFLLSPRIFLCILRARIS